MPKWDSNPRSQCWKKTDGCEICVIVPPPPQFCVTQRSKVHSQPPTDKLSDIMPSHVFTSCFLDRTKSICDVSRTMPTKIHRSLNCHQIYETVGDTWAFPVATYYKLKCPSYTPNLYAWYIFGTVRTFGIMNSCWLLKNNIAVKCNKLLLKCWVSNTALHTCISVPYDYLQRLL
jgi:hypothetical protein